MSGRLHIPPPSRRDITSCVPGSPLEGPNCAAHCTCVGGFIASQRGKDAFPAMATLIRYRAGFHWEGNVLMHGVSLPSSHQRYNGCTVHPFVAWICSNLHECTCGGLMGKVTPGLSKGTRVVIMTEVTFSSGLLYRHTRHSNVSSCPLPFPTNPVIGGWDAPAAANPC